MRRRRLILRSYEHLCFVKFHQFVMQYVFFKVFKRISLVWLAVLAIGIQFQNTLRGSISVRRRVVFAARLRVIVVSLD